MSFGGEFAWSHWNRVDVRGDDGLLHNGRVIDAVAGGFVVDFGGTGHSGPKLFPFGAVFQRDYGDCCLSGGGYAFAWKVPSVEALALKEPMHEVLLRAQTQDPWKWYPARLLNRFGLVSVTLADRHLKGFVAGHRVRGRPDEEYLEEVLAGQCVIAGEFVKKVIMVPSEHGAAIPDGRLIAAFNAHCQQHNYCMKATGVINNANHGVSRELTVLGRFKSDNCVLEWWPNFSFRNVCILPLDQLLLSLLNNMENTRFLTAAASLPDGEIHVLYRDPTIFPEIFACLTTYQQTKIRGVCAHWDAILQSAYIRRVVSVCHPSVGPEYAINLFRFVVCLYNGWTPQTKVLVLFGERTRSPSLVPLWSTARLLQYILSDKGLPAVKTVVLTREWKFAAPVNWVDTLWESFRLMAGVCQHVVLKDFGVHLMRCSSDKRPSITVRFSNQRITRQLTVSDFWTLLNNLLDEDIPEDLLMEWFTEIRRAFPEKIVQILNLTQTLDSRNGVRYRGMSFLPNGDADLSGVDVRQLTNFTLYALTQIGKDPITFHV